MELSIFATQLACGLAWTLTATSPLHVNAGYFRTTLLVVLGLAVLALLAGWSSLSAASAAPLITAALLAYLASSAWLLERRFAGVILTALVSILMFSLLIVSPFTGEMSATIVHVTASVTAAGLLGSTMGAMLLGHFYLTAPWMSLSPMRRLVAMIVIVALLRAGAMYWQTATTSMARDTKLVLLQIVVGILAPAVLAGMAWRTLDFKNTQAATGILYVATICAFVGEAAAIVLYRTVGGAS